MNRNQTSLTQKTQPEVQIEYVSMSFHRNNKKMLGSGSKIWVIFVYKWEWEGYPSRFEAMLRKLAFQNLSLPIALFKNRIFLSSTFFF